MSYLSYSDYRRVARENLEGNWKVSVTTAFVAALLGGLMISSNVNLDLDEETLHRLPTLLIAVFSAVAGIGTVLSIPQLIIGGTVQLGYAHFLLKQYNRASFEVKDLFSQFDHFKQGFLQSLLRGIYILLWTLLFIIPGFVKGFAYAMTPFIMAENPEMTAKDAISASVQLMDGHKMDLFLLGLTFIGWDLLNILTLGIGSLWLNPYKNAAYAAFYKDITKASRDYE